jgi:hypothetical protein
VTTRQLLVLTDDLNGRPAEGTVRFGLDGQDYEMELDAANTASLRSSLAPYIDAGRRVTGSPRRRTRTAPGRLATPPLDATRRAQIRAWAKTQPQLGEISGRGRLGAAIIAAYDKAHR